ncbi:MAG: DUF4387 domain-containing protein [Treponema sp.]|jgi:hypothetical protein|nr:DUF4387 domain-containing protein [Treponema sp.]
MAQVKELAMYVRSKNAGPFWVTVEIFCDKNESYNRIKDSPNITGEKVAALYHVDAAHIKVFYVDSIRVIKFSFPRPLPSGHKYENDMHFGQQYIRLAETEV